MSRLLLTTLILLPYALAFGNTAQAADTICLQVKSKLSKVCASKNDSTYESFYNTYLSKPKYEKCFKQGSEILGFFGKPHDEIIEYLYQYNLLVHDHLDDEGISAKVSEEFIEKLRPGLFGKFLAEAKEKLNGLRVTSLPEATNDFPNQLDDLGLKGMGHEKIRTLIQPIEEKHRGNKDKIFAATLKELKQKYSSNQYVKQFISRSDSLINNFNASSLEQFYSKYQRYDDQFIRSKSSKTIKLCELSNGNIQHSYKGELKNLLAKYLFKEYDQKHPPFSLMNTVRNSPLLKRKLNELGLSKDYIEMSVTKKKETFIKVFNLEAPDSSEFDDSIQLKYLTGEKDESITIRKLEPFFRTQAVKELTNQKIHTDHSNVFISRTHDRKNNLYLALMKQCNPGTSPENAPKFYKKVNGSYQIYNKSDDSWYYELDNEDEELFSNGLYDRKSFRYIEEIDTTYISLKFKNSDYGDFILVTSCIDGVTKINFTVPKYRYTPEKRVTSVNSVRPDYQDYDKDGVRRGLLINGDNEYKSNDLVFYLKTSLRFNCEKLNGAPLDPSTEISKILEAKGSQTLDYLIKHAHAFSYTNSGGLLRISSKVDRIECTKSASKNLTHSLTLITASPQSATGYGYVPTAPIPYEKFIPSLDSKRNHELLYVNLSCSSLSVSIFELDKLKSNNNITYIPSLTSVKSTSVPLADDLTIRFLASLTSNLNETYSEMRSSFLTNTNPWGDDRILLPNDDEYINFLSQVTQDIQLTDVQVTNYFNDDYLKDSTPQLFHNTKQVLSYIKDNNSLEKHKSVVNQLNLYNQIKDNPETPLSDSDLSAMYDFIPKLLFDKDHQLSEKYLAQLTRCIDAANAPLCSKAVKIVNSVLVRLHRDQLDRVFPVYQRLVKFLDEQGVVAEVKPFVNHLMAKSKRRSKSQHKSLLQSLQDFSSTFSDQRIANLLSANKRGFVPAIVNLMKVEGRNFYPYIFTKSFVKYSMYLIKIGAKNDVIGTVNYFDAKKYFIKDKSLQRQTYDGDNSLNYVFLKDMLNHKPEKMSSRYLQKINSDNYDQSYSLLRMAATVVSRSQLIELFKKTVQILDELAPKLAEDDYYRHYTYYQQVTTLVQLDKSTSLGILPFLYQHLKLSDKKGSQGLGTYLNYYIAKIEDEEARIHKLIVNDPKNKDTYLKYLKWYKELPKD